MSQKVKLEAEKPTESGLESEPCVKAETEYPTFKVEPGIHEPKLIPGPSVKLESETSV